MPCVEKHEVSNMARKMTGAWLTLAFLIIPATWAQEQPPVRDISFFLRRLRTVDNLPELEASHTAMSSTWDRSGGNRDGTDFKNIVKPTADILGRNILLDTAFQRGHADDREPVRQAD
jgi:hypothetical protein